MKDFNCNKAFSRNIGFLAKEEQSILSKTSIAVAGAGGDGGLLSERLIRFGIGSIILADPEVFEIENSNRQFAANSKTMGMNKAAAVGAELALINPSVGIRIFSEGINEVNIVEFVSSADVIIDEIEFTIPELSVMLAREARKQKKFLFTGANVGWGASVFCFAPDGMTFEEHFCYDEASKTIDPLKYVKKVPCYFETEMLQRVLSNEISIPTVSSSVGLVASFVSMMIILMLTKKKMPPISPNFFHYDPVDSDLSLGVIYDHL